MGKHLAQGLGITILILTISSPSGALCDGDLDGDNSVSIAELIRAVGSAINGCPAPATPTATATDTPTSTPSSTPTNTASATPSATSTPLPSCGDGRADVDEQCDGRDLNGLSCPDADAANFGRLSCTDDCKLDSSGCSTERFVDNRDGSITDFSTGLIWEKKCAVCDGPHNVDNTYPWSGSCSGAITACRTNDDCAAEQSCTADDGQGTGLTIFTWVDTLNAGSFAGANDWRVPTIEELTTLRDLSTFDPAINEAFARNACPDLTEPACSRTRSSNYWSSTPHAKDPDKAWDLNFDEGSIDSGDASGLSHVRAVRNFP